MAERYSDPEALRRLLELAAAVFPKEANDLPHWLITSSEDLGGQAPIDFLSSPGSVERILAYTRSLTYFRLVVIRPGEAALFDRNGKECQADPGGTQPLGRNLDRLAQNGWRVISAAVSPGELPNYVILAQRK